MGPLELLEEWPVPPAAAAVLVRSGSSVEVAATWGALGVVCEWASVTKLLVAMAVLVAARRGALDLDDPAGPPGSTVRHLLSHASGLGPDLPDPLTAPGRRRIYSNVGFEVLASYLEERIGRSWVEIVRDYVTTPIGLSGTEIAPGGSAASSARGPVHDLAELGRELLVPTVVPTEILDEATKVAFPGLGGVVP